VLGSARPRRAPAPSAVSSHTRVNCASRAGAGLAGVARSECHGKSCGVGSDAGNAIGGIPLCDPASQPHAAVGAGFCPGCENWNSNC